MRVVHERLGAALPPSLQHLHRRLDRRRAAAAALSSAVVLALCATLLWGHHSAATAVVLHPKKAAGHDCPQYGGSILDLPDTADCRRLLAKLAGADCLPNYRQAVVREQPEAECCAHAASFFALQCHCWGSQFDHAAVAAVAAVDSACLAHAAGGQHQQEQGQQQQGQGQQQGLAERLQQGQQAAGQQQREQRLAETLGQLAARAAGGTGAAADVGGIRLFVGVLSAGARREARDAIRATWGAHPAVHRVRFFLARPPDDALFAQLRAEAVEKRDMVVLGHITEHYLNITHQTLEVLRFASADPDTTHVLKVDDDSYVHVDRLLHRLATLHKERMFLGHIENPGGHPQRNPANQWYVSREEWPKEQYPPWAHGAGYVLTADLAAELAPGTAFAASTNNVLFKLEDIAVASWVEWAAEQRGFKVHLIKDRRFNFGGCQHWDLVSHYIKPEQQRCMWESKGDCKCKPA